MDFHHTAKTIPWILRTIFNLNKTFTAYYDYLNTLPTKCLLLRRVGHLQLPTIQKASVLNRNNWCKVTNMIRRLIVPCYISCNLDRWRHLLSHLPTAFVDGMCVMTRTEFYKFHGRYYPVAIDVVKLFHIWSLIL